MNWEKALAEILQHADLIGLLFDALRGGVAKEELVQAIKDKMTAAAREELQKEFREG